MDNREREALRELTEAARGFIDGKPKTLRRLRNATTEAERALGEPRAAIEGEPTTLADEVKRFHLWWDSEGEQIASQNGKHHTAMMAWKARAERVLEAGGDKGAGTIGEPKLVHTAGQYPASVPAAIEGGTEVCPECTLGPPNWSERKPGYCSYCNDTGLRPKVRVLEAGVGKAIDDCHDEWVAKGIVKEKASLPTVREPQGENWWTPEALDAIRTARMHEPNDTWVDWQSAIQGPILRAYNRGLDAALQPVSEGRLREASALPIQWRNIADAKPSSFEFVTRDDAFRYCADQLERALESA